MRSLLFSLCLCAGAPPEITPSPTPPAVEWKELKAAPGRLLRLTSSVAAKWELVDAGADLLPVGDGKIADFVGTTGRYRVLVTGDTGETSRWVIVVGDAPPDPGPGPKPPVPPIDPLLQKLKAAYDADPAEPTVRRNSAKDLAALYREAAKLSADSTIQTSGDLLEQVRAASVRMIGANALRGVRGVVSAELGALLPVDAALADDQRKAVADLFTKLTTLLEGF